MIADILGSMLQNSSNFGRQYIAGYDKLGMVFLANQNLWNMLRE